MKDELASLRTTVEGDKSTGDNAGKKGAGAKKDNKAAPSATSNAKSGGNAAGQVPFLPLSHQALKFDDSHRDNRARGREKTQPRK